MVFDVDKLIEALGFADRFPHARMGVETRPIIDAARLVVAGQPLWWCEEHATISKSPRTQCWVAYDPDERDEADCRMVEGWWMPTGGGE